MERVLHELNYEEEVTAQMYISGLEKKEIADKKCRALSTVTNQLQTVFKKLSVTNGRELCRKFYERVSGVTFTFDFSPAMRGGIAVCLLCVFALSIYEEQGDMRRGRRVRIEMVRRTDGLQRS